MDDDQCGIEELAAILDSDDDTSNFESISANNIGSEDNTYGCAFDEDDDDDIDEDELDKLACLVEEGDTSTKNTPPSLSSANKSDPISKKKGDDTIKEKVVPEEDGDSTELMEQFLAMKKKMEEMEAKLKEKKRNPSDEKNDSKLKNCKSPNATHVPKPTSLPKPHIDTPHPDPSTSKKMPPGPVPKMQLLEKDIFSEDTPLTGPPAGNKSKREEATKPANFYKSKNAPVKAEDSDSDWEGMDGEKPSSLNQSGKELKKLLKRGERDRVAHTSSYSASTAEKLREKAKASRPNAPPKASVSYAASVAGIAAVNGGAVSKPREQRETGENFGGVKVIKPLISSTAFINMTDGRKFIMMSKLHTKVKSSDLNNDWVTVGVIVNKSEPKMSAKGKQFSIWKLSDLFDCNKIVSFFLFNNVHSSHWKIQPGTVIGLLNASVLPNNDKYKSKDNEVSITVDNPKKVLHIGRSRDFGLCKGRTKTGKDCLNFVNKDKGEFCTYHVQAAYKKQSAKRADLQSGFTGVQPAKLKDKIFGGKGGQSFIYGGEMYSNSMKPAKKKTDQPSIKELQAHHNSIQGSEKKVTTLKLHELESEGGDPVESEKNKHFNNLLMAPTSGSMNYVKHLKSAEQIQEKEKEKKKTFISVSAKDLLKQHSDNMKRQYKEPKRAGVLSGGDDLFDLDEMPPLMPKPLRTRNPDIAKRKAAEMLKAKGGINKVNPNEVRKKRSLESEERIRKRLQSSIEDEDIPTDQPPVKKAKHCGGVDLALPEVQKLLKATSKYDGALSQIEEEKFEAYFDTLEKTETLEQKMDSVKEVDCQIYTCIQCNYTAFAANKSCREQGHKIKKTDAKKKFFRCNNCKNRTVHYDRLPPPCKNCGQLNFERVSMLREKKGPKLASEKLLLRGEERKHVNS